ncbi:hypothetical protein C943_00363 [Mariniradius saccharolyticus AK6]|uniref:Uncharacterized protein n=1 Tax=Mariniradius saccharolyticus AK6 TaxID=1239962 RepID=M7Y778_9BACT|nr:hypothetical protein [Mariniradius saccharolyticus]EMS33086.1 hypothetical protein C943_00363 [Mariniradius saccharolyticus AK6]
MKLPSILRVASPQRFEIKPRYYDPIKEEIEQRTARIKKELQAEGKIPLADEDTEDMTYSSSIRGAFASGNHIRGRSTSLFNSASMLRLVIFMILIAAVFGYIYLGPEALYTVAYIVGGLALLVIFFRIKGKSGK